jgi:hypothetical protein
MENQLETINQEESPKKEIITSPGLPLTTEWKHFERGISDILTRPLEDEEIFIRPDGLLYLPQTFYRKKLNESFGAGNWTLYKEKVFQEPAEKATWVYYVGALYAFGQYIGQAGGQNLYYGVNQKTSKMDAVESAKSDCITRICKDLGIGSELWNPEFCFRWKAQNAKHITVKTLFGYNSGKHTKIWVKILSDGVLMVPDGYELAEKIESETELNIESETKLKVEIGKIKIPPIGEEIIFSEEINKEFWKAIKEKSIQDFKTRFGFWADYDKITKKYFVKEIV